MTPTPTSPLVTTVQGGSITEMLTQRVASDPTAVFLRSSHGELTYAELHDRTATLAGSLHHIGVRAGTRVVLFMHNSLDQVVVWFALARLGAVHVPINTALIGTHLQHVLRVADPAVVVVDRDLRHVVHDANDAAPSLQTVIVAGTDLPTPTDTTPPRSTLSLTELLDGGRRAPVHRGSDLDPATMLFTSGTTGPSKACVLSHRYLAGRARSTPRSSGFAPTMCCTARSRSSTSTPRR